MGCFFFFSKEILLDAKRTGAEFTMHLRHNPMGCFFFFFKRNFARRKRTGAEFTMHLRRTLWVAFSFFQKEILLSAKEQELNLQCISVTIVGFLMFFNDLFFFGIQLNMVNFNKFIINKKILNHNIKTIKKYLNKNVKLCACVKANAYGLGMNSVAEIIDSQVDAFAVSNIFEAINLRKITKRDIYILGVVDKKDYDLCSQNSFIVSIGSIDQLKAKNEHCVDVSLAINSGMNRYGFNDVNEFEKAIDTINKTSKFRIKSLFSHFAYSKSKIQNEKQFIIFVNFKRKVHGDCIFHISASSAIMLKEYNEDMVRCGFALYAETELGTKDVVSIFSKIVHINHCKKGEFVGYEGKYIAKKDMDIGVVSLGYADGIDRRLSGFYVLVNGHKCNIVGNICMDCFMVDITDVDVKLFDEVVILGRQAEEEITINHIANYINASPYEFLSRLNYSRMDYIVK